MFYRCERILSPLTSYLTIRQVVFFRVIIQERHASATGSRAVSRFYEKVNDAHPHADLEVRSFGRTAALPAAICPPIASGSSSRFTIPSSCSSRQACRRTQAKKSVPSSSLPFSPRSGLRVHAYSSSFPAFSSSMAAIFSPIRFNSSFSFSIFLFISSSRLLPFFELHVRKPRLFSYVLISLRLLS